MFSLFIPKWVLIERISIPSVLAVYHSRILLTHIDIVVCSEKSLLN